MYTGLLHLHRTIAYAALILIFLAMLKSLHGFLNSKEFTDGDRKLGLFAMISAHLQLTFGLIILIMGIGTSRFGDMGQVMKDSAIRFAVIEHPLMMILGVALITVGYIKAKKGTDSRTRFKSMALFFLIGFALILSRIPWDKLF
ncbi:MAG: hypothetical protein CL840_10405 [Crocinitomicaceae bacterium]|nr:hypothetical protein [Crocinitomicaceae bacterium]|tara:strand:- start:5091 stop:5522 length:432 start_codon:yes stop_codon:yes gene_type:complete